MEFPPLELPRWPVAEDGDCGTQPEEAARCLRREWSVPAGPFGHAVRATENHGIIVVFGTQESSSVDAYSFESSARPLIVLNPLKDDYFRQRFDVAHELGHLVMHAEAEPGSRIVEEQAHRFAAELLMPAGEIAGLLPARADWTKFALLKEQWGVSMQSLLFRSRRLGVMSEATYKNAMTSVSARGWRRREPGPRVAVEQPSLLPATVELLGAHGVEASALAAEARAPMVLFNCITSRTPQAQAAVESESGERRPLSLLRAEGGK
nr:ImmA/IrrE family metallo-endopeptidase [Geodermatophilus sp. Leaf369]